MVSETPIEDKIANVIEFVNNSEISSIKSVVSNILKTLNDPKSSAKNLKEIIEVDPPLTAKIIQLANSAFYGYPKTINEIQEAIVCIGFDTVREIALNQKVCELFRKEEKIADYTRSQLWEHSVAVALTCKMIFRREFQEPGETAYATGLLHDIGTIIMDQFLHTQFVNILKKAASDRINQNEAEKLIFGFDHPELGRALAFDWNFSDEMSYGLAFHHNPFNAPDTYKKHVLTLFIANYSIQENNIGYRDASFADAKLFRECLERLTIKEKAVEIIVDDVKSEIVKMKSSGWF